MDSKQHGFADSKLLLLWLGALSFVLILPETTHLAHVSHLCLLDYADALNCRCHKKLRSRSHRGGYVIIFFHPYIQPGGSPLRLAWPRGSFFTSIPSPKSW
jgi:hypothetical protein